MKLNPKEFDRAVRRAFNRIPAEIRERMDNVVLTVKKRPTREIVEEMGYQTQVTTRRGDKYAIK